MDCQFQAAKKDTAKGAMVKSQYRKDKAEELQKKAKDKPKERPKTRTSLRLLMPVGNVAPSTFKDTRTSVLLRTKKLAIERSLMYRKVL